MSDIERYLEAATRENTRKSYRAAVEHFEVTWGGFLPATADNIAQYLVDYAPRLSISTLRQRLAALSVWHTSQGFPDPTKAPHVKKVMKGIVELHPAQQKQARPLQIEQLQQIVIFLEQQANSSSPVQQLQAIRNKALFLIGFWRAFRSDEMARLQIEHIDVDASRGMRIFIPRSKGDRANNGRHYSVPALKQLCPVSAYSDWLTETNFSQGPVFRKINRWGHISDQGLHPASIIELIKAVCHQAGLANATAFTSHSLRRGFATWANNQGWNTRALMEYVGWRDVQSAMRYIEVLTPFDPKLLQTDLE